MAIFHFSVKNISRSDGRSAVACAAYRSGEKLKDERYGKEQDYTKKTGIEFKNIYAPENTKKELLDRETLWNTVETIETRKNSQLSREFEVAFPCELNQEQREKMLNELCGKIVERHKVVVDAVIHAPHTAGGSDDRNYHAHIMLTTRSINQQGNLDKKTREFNDNGKQEVEHWRQQFAELCNQFLEQVGSHERVDHRSYKEQGLNLEATQHEGSTITQLRRQGKDTEISLSNDAIKARNTERQLIKGLEQEILATERLVHDLEQTRKNLDQEQRSPEELTKIAYSVISQYNDTIATEAKNIASSIQKTEIERINAVLEQIELSKSDVKHQKEELGKRPLFFGGKWDTANAEIQKQLNQLEEQERELRNNSPRLEPERYTDRAKQTVDKSNPNLKAKYDRARNYLEREQQRKLAEQEQRKQDYKAQQERERQAFLARKALREQGKNDEANKLLEASKLNNHKPRSR
ncbi:MobQ family relaxase [Acinetobacter ursingii]|uniref:MobQ family relaxase n=1 Tax=Acinetobacter ursingii TaxID=108980 RepID=UPI001F084CF5|nr:MobA/MobL family protein [Acinetobacter ursingii]